MNRTRILLLLVSIGFGLSLGAWRIEHRKRLAAEARYQYDFEGVLELEKVPPRAMHVACGYCDTSIAITTRDSEIVSFFTWKDSVWHYISAKGWKDLHSLADDAGDTNSLRANALSVTAGVPPSMFEDWIINASCLKDPNAPKSFRWRVSAQWRGKHYYTGGATCPEAYRKLDEISVEERGFHCCVDG